MPASASTESAAALSQHAAMLDTPSEKCMQNEGQMGQHCHIRYNRTALEAYADTDAISLLCSISTRSCYLQSGPTIISGLEIPWSPKILQNIRLLAEYHTIGLATDPC